VVASIGAPKDDADSTALVTMAPGDEEEKYVKALLGPTKLPKNGQEAKKQLRNPIFDSQEAENDDSGPFLGAKSGFCKNPTPATSGGRILRLRGGPKRLKNGPLEVKNAQSTSNGTFLRSF